MHEDITYGDIHQSQDNLWNFLFFTGYLKKISERKDESGETLYLTMAIPNTEIKTIYKNSITYWFEQRMKETDRSPLKHALETGDCEAAEDFINEQSSRPSATTIMPRISIMDSWQGCLSMPVTIA